MRIGTVDLVVAGTGTGGGRPGREHLEREALDLRSEQAAPNDHLTGDRVSRTDDSGEHLRKIGAEYGTTTGRPRRCGWYDTVIARYAARVNGVTDFVLTKLDVLTGLDEIPVCVAYEVDGKRCDELPMTQAEFARATPVYESFPGWTEDISTARSLDDLPKNARDYVAALEAMINAPISVIGVGPGRDESIVVHDLLR